MPRSLKDIASSVQARVLGNADTMISTVASIASASPGAIVFAEDPQALTHAMASTAAAVIAGEFASQSAVTKPVLISSHPKLAFARAARLLAPAVLLNKEIHPTAIVSSSARLSNDVAVGPHAVIGEEVEVGERSRIGAGSVIGAQTSIGEGCEIYPRVTIYPGTRIGSRVILHAGVVLGSDGFGYVRDKQTGRYEKFPQVGRLEIEDDVEIGANTTVDRGALEVTRIARGTKIDNLVHVGHNVQIGEDVVIAAQTGFSGSITVEKNAVIGGQVGIGEQATIGEGVMLGGQSGVLPKKVLRGKGIAFWGTPAKPVRQYLKELAVLARLARKARD
jgi:UDP-3-O-[3-hydroxymyristoyl] glucosamine N-acyltransferase